MTPSKSRTTTAALLVTACGVAVAATLVSGAPMPGSSQNPISTVSHKVTKPVEPPKIDVVFALDTTSSMSGLIEGAKQKIWSLANEIAAGQPQPIVRFGLVAFRDRGDEYITKMTPLTRDMDALYQELTALHAAGGGDGPEHVNQAIFDALHRIQWGTDQRTLKLLFVVGDAPPHDDYDDGLNSVQLAQRAKEKGVVVNTVRCGSGADTQRVWKQLASIAGGTYVSIEQGGGMVAVATPFDGKLAKLNAELASTTIGYGDSGTRDSIRTKVAARRAMAPGAAAAASSYSSKYATLGMGKGDLVAAVMAGEAKPAELEEDSLPAPMQAMDKEERTAFVQKKVEERQRVQATIAELGKKRDEWMKKNAKTKAGKDSFDRKIMESVAAQANDIGVAY